MAVAVVTLLTGCVAQEAEVTVDESVTVTEIPTEGLESERYEDVTSLVAAINAGGVACKDMRLLDAPQESIEDFGLCFITPEYEKDIYLFRTVEDRDAWAGGFSDNPDIHLLVGPNWFITSGSAEELAQIQAVIGGDLRTSSES